MPINNSKEIDIKKICNQEYLRSLIFQHNAMLGFVTKKASKVNKNISGSATL